MACTGTHDTNTVCGWFEDDCSPQERKNVLDYIGEPMPLDSTNKPLTSALNPLPSPVINWQAISLMMQSVADMVIFPLQDILGYGSESRMNIPGTRKDNWRWRFTEDALTEQIGKKLAGLTLRYGRA